VNLVVFCCFLSAEAERAKFGLFLFDSGFMAPLITCLFPHHHSELYATVSPSSIIIAGAPRCLSSQVQPQHPAQSR